MRILSLILTATFIGNWVYAQTVPLAKISIEETAGLPRNQEIVEFHLQTQLPLTDPVYFYVQPKNSNQKIVAESNGKQTDAKSGITWLNLIFPVDMEAYESAIFEVFATKEHLKVPRKNFIITGKDLGISVENPWFIASTYRDNSQPNKNHQSGQLQSLVIKDSLGNPQVTLQRSFNRMHWAPNFQKSGAAGYKTIAHWERPSYQQFIGNYTLKTYRSGPAPDHPEIHLAATYTFYADRPFFRFASSMTFQEGVMMYLLRNEEMTMDSLFTHLAFQRTDGSISSFTFGNRQEVLDTLPLESEAPWICFFNKDMKYAYGAIRVSYDNTNKFGEPSPLYKPHTKISNGANGGKYWNRRLIHERDTWVPQGSQYQEETLYLVFRVDFDQNDPYAEIKYWAARARAPLQVKELFERY